MLRILVVGAGQIAQSVHLPAIHALADRYRLIGVVDASPERAAEVARRHGTDAYRSLSDGIHASGADAVLLSTPGDHAALADEALTAHVHVLAEKPLALSVAKAEALAARADDVDRVLWVGYMKMCDPAVALAREALPQLGPIRLVDVRVVHPLDERQVRHINMVGGGAPDPALITSMAADEAEDLAAVFGEQASWVGRWYPDVLLGSVVHEFSVLRALGYVPPDAYDHVDVWPWPAIGQPPCLLAAARLGADADGARLSLGWIWAPQAAEYRETIRIVGDAGEIHVDVAAPYLLDVQSEVRVIARDGDRTEERAVRGAPVGSFRLQLEAFHASIEHGGPNLSPAVGAAQDARSAQALVRRWAEHHGMTIPGEEST